jgi:radical SAM superfamily enzyme YgiQ (UPF0313 family)
MTTPFVLLSLDWIRSKDPRTSLGHASLLANLSVHGIETVEVRRAVNAPDYDLRSLEQMLFALNPWFLGIGVYIWNEADVGKLLRGLRARGWAGEVILGGPQISHAPAGVAALYPEAEHFIRGPGENALVSLMSALLRGETPEPIAGYLHRDQLDTCSQAKVELTELPSPYLMGVLPVTPFIRWETQRGCRYACTFCQHREAGKIHLKSTFDQSRIRAEIDLFCAQGARDIAILDPIFPDNPEAPQILNYFREKGFTGRISIQCRFETLSDALLDATRDLDVRLEFGLQTVAETEMRAIGRMNNLNRVAERIGEVNARGLTYEVSLIYGLPTQTLASFQATLAWCEAHKVQKVVAWPLMLLRGTPLEKRRAQWALQENRDPIPLVVASSTFTEQEWAEMAQIGGNLPERPATLGPSPGRSPIGVVRPYRAA